MKKGLDDQIKGLKAKINRLIEEGKHVPVAKRLALVNLIVARQNLRRRKEIVRELSA